MILTITNPFDNEEIEIELIINISGVIDSDGSKSINVQASGFKQV
jgi:hypothetical protein